MLQCSPCARMRESGRQSLFTHSSPTSTQLRICAVKHWNVGVLFQTARRNGQNRVKGLYIEQVGLWNTPWPSIGTLWRIKRESFAQVLCCIVPQVFHTRPELFNEQANFALQDRGKQKKKCVVLRCVVLMMKYIRVIGVHVQKSETSIKG